MKLRERPQDIRMFADYLQAKTAWTEGLNIRVRCLRTRETLSFTCASMPFQGVSAGKICSGCTARVAYHSGAWQPSPSTAACGNRLGLFSKKVQATSVEWYDMEIGKHCLSRPTQKGFLINSDRPKLEDTGETIKTYLSWRKRGSKYKKLSYRLCPSLGGSIPREQHVAQSRPLLVTFRTWP